MAGWLNLRKEKIGKLRNLFLNSGLARSFRVLTSNDQIKVLKIGFIQICLGFLDLLGLGKYRIVQRNIRDRLTCLKFPEHLKWVVNFQPLPIFIEWLAKQCPLLFSRFSQSFKPLVALSGIRGLLFFLLDVSHLLHYLLRLCGEYTA
jgi:hypothetical protein